MLKIREICWMCKPVPMVSVRADIDSQDKFFHAWDIGAKRSSWLTFIFMFN